jgi:hypothetical protein
LRTTLPTFDAVGPFCNGATITPLPTTSLNGITGTWSPAINNTATTEYTFTPDAGQCATTSTLTITIEDNITPTFDAVGPFCNGATITPLPTTSLNGITGTWSPAINNTATTEYTFTPDAGQCATTSTLTITIEDNITPTFDAVGPFCNGATITPLPTTSLNGITGTWSPAINNTATTEYTFTPDAGQCATTSTLTITIEDNITPTFDAVGPFCNGATITPLPTTSLNGITGTWSPAINNTATTEYTFTPDAGQCATTSTLTITIEDNITPTFDAVGPFCNGATITPLPTTSLNGITGTWSPAINNTATTEYTFTPDAGQCATTSTLTITIEDNITPTFDAVGPFCNGATITPLPTTSLNGITGTWSPAINNTATTEYTFTPDAGQCATTSTLTITIEDNITPTFDAVGPFCNGATITPLPTTSLNGITGTWSPAINNTATTEYTFTPDAGQCATTSTLTITIEDNITPTFDAVGPFCNGATITPLPTTSLNGITGTWSPAINNTATTEYTFTPDAGQCATTSTLTITIEDNITPTFDAVGPFCNGATITPLPTTSLNGITGTWSPAINNTATTEYTFTPDAGQCATTSTLTITIEDNITPTFDAVGPFCNGATITPLPTTSLNGITGTWSPAINNTATTEYTFTPDAGQCATTTTLTITIEDNITPTFDAVGPFCNGATITPLPTTSLNGITGTWSPAINNTATTEYTFTPDAGQCATTTTLTITIEDNITPTFDAVGPFCNGATITPLPTTSLNGITGTWSPAINNTATTEYTFTPDAGQCATTSTLTITIEDNITPTFDAVGPFCNGATITPLPTTSLNGITGTWSPAINNTATTEYTFTPDAGQCATTSTLTITIEDNITPTFDAVGPFCNGATITPLPTTSLNGITGTWSPAINNTATTEYTFTPDAGQCATTTTLTITIEDNITPTFDAVGPFCNGATITPLPTTSLNGITGTWSPAINNTATTEYTFTPDAGQCATTSTLTITIEDNITPTFDAVGPFCNGATITPLPTTSLNGITGTWSPAINNTATTEYTFTPDAGQCATTSTLTITIEDNITPTFDAVGPFCNGATITPLPTTSLNGITGTWSPAINNTATTEYTFTPDAGQCATTSTLTITIEDNITPTFDAVGPFCNGATITPLPTTSLNGITGTWSPAINNTATTEYTFTPDAGQCATTSTLTITIEDNITPTFDAVGPFCNGATITPLPTTSLNGITGTWSPAINNTATTEYTFTPDAGQCATTSTLTITIEDNITPTFDAVGPFCNGATITPLPTTSLNGITGTWSPAINNTATTEYTFTPDAGQCATTSTLTITIEDNITPTFDAVGPFCNGATITPLPTTSLNGITGTWSPAINNTATTEYTFTPDAGQCATTSTLTITIEDNITPTFDAVGPFCNGATITPLPTTSLNGITGTWSPAINNTATTEYTFTPDAGQCATTSTLTITIEDNITPTFDAVGPFCNGATITPLPTTSLNGITGTWSPAINNTATTEYTFTPDAGQCATTTTLTITIEDNITPTFDAVGPFCNGATITPLPTTSLNGITGTWSPAINNTATTEYTFTPDAGQCATTSTLTITIEDNITPTFDAVGPFCNGATITPLPTTSLNGITGTWSPAINNTATTEYTFTPDAGQCATTSTLTITIEDNITPTFDAVGPFCNGATITPLPTTSLNGITGTWSPAINNTATTEYTFTPDAGQCATTSTLTITIEDNITPTFDAVGPFCNGATITPLPTTSLNGITGTWSPAINNTATTEYTFTPDAGQCATTSTLTITIEDNITPTFDAVGPFCNGATITPLPTTSLNGITGTWSPAINNTATTEYTFTPDAGQCATTSTLTITIEDNITPTFDAVGPFCNGATITPLPTTSLNGITGTWSPAINNTATTEYTFTPDAGQCATTSTLTITIEDNITPTFDAVGPFCNGATITPLPTTSLNGITGTWSPAINNTATTEYTFTPDAGQCATTSTLTITIEDNITPTFDAVGPFCNGATITPLPTTSLNGITGTWSPAINNTATTEY